MLAAKANIDLVIKVFVTRSDAGSLSGSPSLDGHGDEYLDEKGPSGEPFKLAARSLRFRGRPDVHAEVASAVSDSGRTLVVGECRNSFSLSRCGVSYDADLSMPRPHKPVDRPSWPAMWPKLQRPIPARASRSR